MAKVSQLSEGKPLWGRQLGSQVLSTTEAMPMPAVGASVGRGRGRGRSSRSINLALPGWSRSSDKCFRREKSSSGCYS